MTDIDIEDLRAKLAARKEPWEIIGGGEYVMPVGILVAPDDGGVGRREADLIVAAVNALPALLDEIERLRSGAIGSVAAERARQITVGWTVEHDDEHDLNHLVNRAMTYAAAGRYERHISPDLVREQLVKGAATLVAAIEWLDRAEAARQAGGTAA